MTKPSCPVAPVTRRTFMSAAAAALAAPALVIPGRARAADGPVVFVTWGGVVAKAVKELLAEPFTRETGIPVVIADGPDLAKVKAQIQTGNIEWDILDLPGAMAMSGSKSGFWEPIDTDIVRTGNLLLPNPTSDLVLIDTYAGGASARRWKWRLWPRACRSTRSTRSMSSAGSRRWTSSSRMCANG
jgi:putative spermidine/putrescine transport system substrate-binding protein